MENLLFLGVPILKHIRVIPAYVNWKTLSVNPTVKGYYFFESRKDRQQKERKGLLLSYAVPKIMWKESTCICFSIEIIFSQLVLK